MRAEVAPSSLHNMGLDKKLLATHLAKPGDFTPSPVGVVIPCVGFTTALLRAILSFLGAGGEWYLKRLAALLALQRY